MVLLFEVVPLLAALLLVLQFHSGLEHVGLDFASARVEGQLADFALFDLSLAQLVFEHQILLQQF